MSGNDKNLNQVLGEVIGESIKEAGNKSSTTGGELSKDKSGDTETGGTPEYASGIDISDIPVEDRPRFKAHLEKKAKLLEGGYQKKFEEVSKLKKAQDYLVSQGVTAEEAENVIAEHIRKKQNPVAVTNDKKDAVKTLDKLIENAPYEQKETLQQMRQIILEETNSNKLEKELKAVRDEVNYLRSKDLDVGKTQAMKELDTLKDKFGKDLIENYSDKVMGEWHKYPNTKVKDILKYVVPDEEYEQALLSKKSKSENKLNAISSNGSGVTTSTATIDIRKTSLKDIVRGVLKDKK